MPKKKKQSPKPKPEYLGWGAAREAAEKVGPIARKQRECKAMGMSYDKATGRCV